MTLHWSPRSPFVRKVLVAAHELGLAGRIDLVRTAVRMTQPNAALLPENPLSKIPTLRLADGTVLLDSVVICEYLDALAGGGILFPPAGPARWQALTRHALGNGLLDILILWRNERDKPIPKQLPALLDSFGVKTRTALDHFERDAPALAATPFGIGHIAIGCCLSYLDFRFPGFDWRAGHRALTDWHSASTPAPQPRPRRSTMPDTTMRSGPLSHLRVLDLSRIMAAPWSTQILADLGADVVKVERPGAGDDTRSWGPPFLADAEGKPTRDAGYFLAVNRGKRSVTIDLAKPEGQEIVRRLASGVDVVIENFKAGNLARYGLDAATLRAANPRLIYCSVTGFGQDGPRRDQAAYDFAVQAMGGLMSVTGERDDTPGGGPQKVGVPIVDLMTGMYATVAILAAVARRAETGQGETIDLAMLDVQAAFLANQAMNWLVGGRMPARGGNRHPNIQPQDVFGCADGQFVLAVGNDGQFAKLCEVIGRPELAQDERFARNAARVRNNALLSPLLTERFRGFTKAALTAALDAAGVPCGPINSIPQVFDDPQLVHRRMLRDLPHPVAGSVPQVVSPMNFAEAPLRFDRAPPTLGQHTAEVLRELGLGDADIAALATDGIV